MIPGKRLGILVVAVLLALAAGCSDGDPTTTSDAPLTPDQQPSAPPTTDPSATESLSPTVDSSLTATATASSSPVDALAGVGDSFYPLLGNGGYDVIHYDIDLDVAVAENSIDAVTTVTAVATQDLTTFNLDFHGLDVTEVTVDDRRAGYSRNGKELTIRPADSITSGTTFEVAVTYSGIPQPVEDPGVGLVPLGWHANGGVIYTVSEPSGGMTWYPGNHHPTDKATFTFHLTVPDGVAAAATGLLTNESSAAGRTTTTWRMDDPMASYLAAVYIGDFERHEQRLPDGLLIRDYLPKGADASMLDRVRVAIDAIGYFEDIVGPYPFDAYGTIVMPFTLGYALENQTLSIHGPDRIGSYVIAHEVLHQWIGNSVTLDDWSETWLHEGFAHYLSLMFIADRNDLDINAVMAGEHRDLVETGTTPPGAIEIHELFDTNPVYRRGALTLHALRTQVGEEQFLAILRTHYDRAAGGNTNTDAFLGIVGDIGGAEAVAVVRAWLFDPEMPAPESPLTPVASR